MPQSISLLAHSKKRNEWRVLVQSLISRFIMKQKRKKEREREKRGDSVEEEEA